MIKIVLTDSGEVLDLFSDMKLPLERSNPFFSADGSGSLPVDIPNSLHNRSILGDAGNPAIATTPVKDIDVVLNIYGVETKAVLTVISNDDNTKIYASIIFGESIFYNNIASLRLKDVFSDLSFGIKGNINTLASYLSSGQPTELSMYYFITTDYLEVKAGNDKEYYAITPRINSNAESYMVDGVSISCPPLFLNAPQLNLGYILTRIFDFNGFTLDISEFDEASVVSVLNSVADSCCEGVILYDDLVPDCSVSDFLEAVRKTFNVDFLYSLIDGKFSARKFYNEGSQCLDFTPYCGTMPVIKCMDKKQLKITGDIVNVSKYTELNNSEETIKNYEPALGDYKSYENIELGVKFPAMVKIGENSHKVVESLYYYHTSINVSGETKKKDEKVDKAISFICEREFSYFLNPSKMTSGNDYNGHYRRGPYAYLEGFLHVSMPECSVKLKLPLYDFLAHDFMTSILLFGAKYVIKTFKVELGADLMPLVDTELISLNKWMGIDEYNRTRIIL